MDKQAKEARRAYYKEWRRRNPDKVRENNLRYWRKKAEEAKNKKSGVYSVQ